MAETEKTNNKYVSILTDKTSEGGQGQDYYIRDLDAQKKLLGKQDIPEEITDIEKFKKSIEGGYLTEGRDYIIRYKTDHKLIVKAINPKLLDENARLVTNFEKSIPKEYEVKFCIVVNDNDRFFGYDSEDIIIYWMRDPETGNEAPWDFVTGINPFKSDSRGCIIKPYYNNNKYTKPDIEEDSVDGVNKVIYPNNYKIYSEGRLDIGDTENTSHIGFHVNEEGLKDTNGNNGGRFTFYVKDSENSKGYTTLLNLGRIVKGSNYNKYLEASNLDEISFNATNIKFNNFITINNNELNFKNSKNDIYYKTYNSDSGNFIVQQVNSSATTTQKYKNIIFIEGKWDSNDTTSIKINSPISSGLSITNGNILSLRALDNKDYWYELYSHYNDSAKSRFLIRQNSTDGNNKNIIEITGKAKDDDTKVWFWSPIKVKDIGEQTTGSGITFHSSVFFGGDNTKMTVFTEAFHTNIINLGELSKTPSIILSPLSSGGLTVGNDNDWKFKVNLTGYITQCSGLVFSSNKTFKILDNNSKVRYNIDPNISASTGHIVAGGSDTNNNVSISNYYFKVDLSHSGQGHITTKGGLTVFDDKAIWFKNTNTNTNNQQFLIYTPSGTNQNNINYNNLVIQHINSDISSNVKYKNIIAIEGIRYESSGKLVDSTAVSLYSPLKVSSIIGNAAGMISYKGSAYFSDYEGSNSASFIVDMPAHFNNSLRVIKDSYNAAELHNEGRIINYYPSNTNSIKADFGYFSSTDSINIRIRDNNNSLKTCLEVGNVRDNYSVATNKVFGISINNPLVLRDEKVILYDKVLNFSKRKDDNYIDYLSIGKVSYYCNNLESKKDGVYIQYPLTLDGEINIINKSSKVKNSNYLKIKSDCVILSSGYSSNLNRLLVFKSNKGSYHVAIGIEQKASDNISELIIGQPNSSALNGSSDTTYGDNIPLDNTYARIGINGSTFHTKVSAEGGFFDTSDGRLKTNFIPIKVDLDSLSKLQKVHFDWKDKKKMGSSRQLGMIAQEVQELYPELISTSEDGTLSLAYNKLGVIALEAIDLLHKENKELRSELQDMKARLEKLESLICGGK